MKKLLCILLSVLMLLSVFTVAVSAEATSVADFGWETDEEDGIKNYDGWTTEDGTTITATTVDAVEDNRIWKNLIEDEENFSVTLQYNANNTSSGYMKVLGVSIELDGRHGNGNQVYLKVDGQGKDWISCTNCDIPVTFNRKDGGKLTVLLKGGPTLELEPKESSVNLELGLYAGTVVFGDITVGEPIDIGAIEKTPADFGWQTDSSATFNGWTAKSAVEMTVDYGKTDGDHRIWKSFIEDEDDYAASLRYAAAAESSGYIKVQGNIVELDSRSGKGDELNIKINSEEQGWIKADSMTADLSVSRVDGGKLALAIRGLNGETVSFEMDKKESNTNLELGIYAGKLTFSAISFDGSGVIVPGEKTPADFGWKTDDSASYAGWKAENAANLTATYDETDGNHRLWKNLLKDDEENFVLTITYKASAESSGYIKLFGNKLELDSRNGNGDELYLKLNDADEGTWYEFAGCVATVTITRKNGGSLTIQAGDYSQTIGVKENNSNVEIGIYEGVVNFSGFAVTEPGNPVVDPDTKTPGDFGWETDNSDFSGWTATDAANITADYDKTANNHRIWKKLTESWNNCYVFFKYTGSATSSGFFKVMGNIVEFNCRGGNGNQIYLKVGEGSGDWVDAKNCAASVLIQRGAKGNLKVTVMGDGNPKSVTFELTPSEVNQNFEIGCYAGVNKFTGITGGAQSTVFTDVPVGSWYYNAVYSAVAQGLFNGTSATAFSPLNKMSRAMLVQVLYNLEGKPTVSTAPAFADVKAGDWFANAVVWASENNIVSGTGNGKFDPNGNITREQIASILFRYAAFKGADISGSAELTAFPDQSKVSSWALASVKWAVSAGLISGKTSNGTTVLDPKGNATRAEVSSMMVRFVDFLSK